MKWLSIMLTVSKHPPISHLHVGVYQLHSAFIFIFVFFTVCCCPNSVIKKTKSYIITCNKCVHEYPEGSLPAYSGKMFCSYCKIALQYGIKIKTSQKQHFKDSNSIRVTRVIRINLNPKCRKFWFVTDTLF